MLDADDDIVIHSVAFGPGGAEITYQETRHHQAIGERIQTIILKDERYDVVVEDLIVSVKELVDTYAVDERNPPDRIRTRRSLEN